MNQLVRLPLNYKIDAPEFKINQYYRLIEETENTITLFQAFYNYSIIVEKNIVIEV